MSRDTEKGRLIEATIIWGCAGFIGVVPAGLSPMLLDAPGSERQPVVILLLLSTATFPLACLVSIIMSWRAYRTGNFAGASHWTRLPLLNIAAAVASLVWMTVFHSGRLNGWP